MWGGWEEFGVVWVGLGRGGGGKGKGHIRGSVAEREGEKEGGGKEGGREGRGADNSWEGRREETDRLEKRGVNGSYEIFSRINGGPPGV